MAVPAAGKVTHQREGEELWLEQRRGEKQHRQTGGRPDLRITSDRDPEPGEDRRYEGNRHGVGTKQCARERPARVECAHPRHEDHEAKYPAGAAADVQTRHDRAGKDASENAPAGMGK